MPDPTFRSSILSICYGYTRMFARSGRRDLGHKADKTAPHVGEWCGFLSSSNILEIELEVTNWHCSGHPITHHNNNNNNNNKNNINNNNNNINNNNNNKNNNRQQQKQIPTTTTTTYLFVRLPCTEQVDAWWKRSFPWVKTRSTHHERCWRRKRRRRTAALDAPPFHC